MRPTTPNATVPFRLIQALIDHAGVPTSDIVTIEITYRVMRVTTRAYDDSGKLFVGMDGTIGCNTLEFPLQTWKAYQQESLEDWVGVPGEPLPGL